MKSSSLFLITCLLLSLIYLSACASYPTSSSESTSLSTTSATTSSSEVITTEKAETTQTDTLISLSAETFQKACDARALTMRDLSSSYPEELIHLMAYDDTYSFVYRQFVDSKDAQDAFENDYTSINKGEEDAGLEGTIERFKLANGEVFIYTGNERLTEYCIYVQSGDRELSGTVWSLDQKQASELMQFFSIFGFVIDQPSIS